MGFHPLRGRRCGIHGGRRRFLKQEENCSRFEKRQEIWATGWFCEEKQLHKALLYKHQNHLHILAFSGFFSTIKRVCLEAHNPTSVSTRNHMENTCRLWLVIKVLNFPRRYGIYSIYDQCNFLSEQNQTHEKCNLTCNNLVKESATEVMHRQLNPI